MEDDGKPQDIVCSGGIKLNLGAVFGDRPERQGDDDGE